MASTTTELSTLLQKYASSSAQLQESLAGTLSGLLVVRWAETEDAERAAMAAFNGEDYAPILPAPVRWSWLREVLPLDPARDLWPRVYAAIGLPAPPVGLAVPEDHLDAWLSASLVDWARALPMESPADRRAAAGALAELFTLDGFASQRAYNAGQHHTPPALAALMVALAAPEPGDRLYDPCFGTGGLLCAAAEALWSAGTRVSPAAWTRAIEQPVSGVEVDHRLLTLAFVRLLLMGMRPALQLGDALMRAPGPGFDVVLANPPWGGVRGPDEVHDLPVRSRSREGLFLQHALRALRPGGRAVLALPRAFLWREGGDAETRAWAQSHGYALDAVVHVPAQGRSGVPVSVVLLRAGPARAQVPVLTLDALPTSTQQMDALVSALRTRAEVPGVGELHRVHVSDMVERDHRWVVPPEQAAEGADTLAELRGLVPLLPLGKVATVIGGRTPPAPTVATVLPGSSPVVRVGDLVQERVELGARYALPDEPNPVNAIRRVDVLVSLRGTVGKTAVGQRLTWIPGRAPAAAVIETLGPPLAGTGVAIVRPTDALNPEYLHAILRSEPIQALIRAHARGAGVQGVSLSDLRRIRIPVPSLQVQERLARRLRERPEDPVGALLALVRGAEDHPILRVLREHPAITRLLAGDEPAPADEDRLVYESVEAVQRAASHDAPDARPAPQGLLDWSQAVARVTLDMLDRTAARRQGTEPTVALTLVENRLRSARRRVTETDEPAGRLARQLTDRWIRWARDAQVRAAADFRFAVYTDQVQFDGVGGGTASIEVRLGGTASLRNLRLTLMPGDHTTFLPTLVPGGSAFWEVTLTGDRPTEVMGDTVWHQRTVRWSAQRMDDLIDTGEFPVRIGFTLEPDAPLDTAEDLGGSPYDAGGVISDPDLFVGRKDVIGRILTQLQGNTRVVLLEGNRRMGKTSLLRQLQRPALGLTDTWVPVYASFQGASGAATRDGLPTEQIFKMLVLDIAKEAAQAGYVVPLPDMPPVSEPREFPFQVARARDAYFLGLDPYEALQLYVDLVIDRIAPKRLLLMLDEFDKVQVGIETGVTSPLVPENLRHLAQTRRSVGLLLSGSRRLRHLRESYWSALFGLGYRVGLDPLSVAEAEELVTRPASGRLRFTPDAVRLIQNQSARHPYLLQMLCARVFEVCRERRIRRVDPPLVEEAIMRTVLDNEHFATLWAATGTARRRYLLSLVLQRGQRGDRVTVDLLWALAEQDGVVATTEEIAADVEDLRELELLRLIETPGGASYELEIPMMGAWMARHRDMAEVRRQCRLENT